MDLSPSPDSAADDDGHRRQGRSPSPGTPAPEPDDGGSGWGSDKPPSRAEEGRMVGKATTEPSPSPDSTTSSRHQVPLSSPPATPAPGPEDGGGSDNLTRAEEGRIAGKAIMDPSPSLDSTISSHHNGGHQVVLSSPPGTPAPDPEDGGSGGSNNLTRAVSLFTLAEAGLTSGKAGFAPSAADPSASPPGSAVSSEPDDGSAGENKRTHARFLVTHAEAGLIIGMGGSAVAAVEARSGARVKLSRHDELLPGTDRRVVLVSGLLSEVMDAMELILERLLYQGDQVTDSQATLVLVVPQPCCGVLIGKGGSVIKSLTEVSEAEIKISPQNISYGLNDRLVTITGSLDNQLRAVFLIIFELLEDVRYSFAYAAATPNTPMRSPVNKDAQESLTIAVADEYMGAVIGRAGRIINEISKVLLG